MFGLAAASAMLPKVLDVVKKTPLWFWLVIVIGVGYWHYDNQLDEANAQVARVLLAGDSTVTLLNGDWSARLAQKHQELESANELADELNATLVVSASIEIIPEPVVRDTITLVTEVTSDSTRIATLSDTSVVAILDLSVTAPPCCADIKVNFTLTPLPIEFDVALIQTTDNEAVFAVSYFGGVSRISAPYARLPEKQDRFKPFVGVSYDFLDTGWRLEGGAELALVFGVEIEAFIQQTLRQQMDGKSLRLLVRGRKLF